MEKRLERLENKVDRIEDTVVEIRTDMKHYNNKVEDHLKSDAGIIKTISPILEKLPQIVEIAEQYQFEKQLEAKKTEDRNRRNELAKFYSIRLGIISTIIGIAIGASKLF